jgi:dihydrofolate synthase/folylpolyglutamate synthase
MRPPAQLTYAEAVAFFEGLIDYERTVAGAAAVRLWNLDRVRTVLAAFGNPHQGIRCLHIAGTKGKGSTAAMAASILTAAGFRTGLYTSPHLLSPRERIRIDGQPIAETALAALISDLKPHLEALRGGPTGDPSFFEAYTLAALMHFARSRVDFAVVETGLGGRLDATNILRPLVCAITRIGRDHMAELGETLLEIAREKAGIIKPGAIVVSAPQTPEVSGVIEMVCRQQGARLLRTDQSVTRDPTFAWTQIGEMGAEGQSFSLGGTRGRYVDLWCPLVGTHQLTNAMTALWMVESLHEFGVDVDPEAVRKGLAEVCWPGRFQVIRKEPWIVLDGAHDGVSAEALADTVGRVLSGRPVHLVLGIARDKDPIEIGRPLCGLAREVIFTRSRSPRAREPEELSSALASLCAASRVVPSVGEALAAARESARPGDVVVATGSLYVVGEALEFLKLSV